MKYLSILVVFTVLVFAGSANAQTPAAGGAKSYTYVMKNINGLEPEIIDQLSINGSTISSDRLSSSGYKAGAMTERVAANNSTQFDVTFKSATEGTMHYSGVITSNTIDGTIIVTDKTGKQTTMAMRGMPTEEFNNIQKVKKDYQAKEAAKQK